MSCPKASTWRPSVAPVPLHSLATYVPRPGHVVVTKMPKRARSTYQFRSWFAAMRSVSESHRANGPPCSPAPLRRRSLLWPRLPRVYPRPSRHPVACCDAVPCARRLVLRLRDIAPAVAATDPSLKVQPGEENGGFLHGAHLGLDRARCCEFPMGSVCGARGTLLHSGERSCRSGSLSLTGNGLSWSRPRGHTDSPTSITRSHLAPTVHVVKANVNAFGILWPLKFIILNRLFAQVADTEPGAELRSAPGLVRPADARAGWAEGSYGPRPRTGEESMTERIFVRGLGCRPNGVGG